MVARFLGSINYGIVGVAMVPVSIMTLFGDWGIRPAMIRFLARYRSRGRDREAKGILFAGLLAKFLIGLLLSLIAILSAPFLATRVFNRSDLTPLIKIVSFTLVLNSLLTASQASFIGFERMEFYSLTMFLRSSMKTLLSPFLVLLGYGALGALLGQTLSLLLTSVAALLMLYFSLWRPFRGDGVSLNFLRNLRTMLSYGYPLFISTLLAGALAQIYNFLMALHCSESMIGNYLAASNFSVLITFLTMPISTVLFPAFSQLDQEREGEALRIVFQNSVKYTALVTLPVIAALVVLSQPLIHILFGRGYESAPLFLMLYALSYITFGLGSLSITNLLNGQGRTRATMTLNVAALSLGLPLSLCLIPRFQIIGLLVTMITANIPPLVIGAWLVKKGFGFTIDLNSSLRICAATLVSALLVSLFLPRLGEGDVIALFLGGFLLLLLYVLFIVLMRAVGRNDIASLREILSELGPFSYLFNLLLSLADKILTLIPGGGY